MDLHGIREIEVETVGDDVTYRLPVRPLGLFRVFGLVPMGFSVLWFSTIIHIVGIPIRVGLNHQHQGFNFFLLPFLLIFALAGCVPAGMGLAILFGRCRVRWRNGHVMATEWVGPFGWPRRLPRSPIRKFVVAASSAAAANGQTLANGPIRVGALLAHFETGIRRVVVAGYPREWLEALAQDLSRRAGCSQSAAPKVEVVAAGEQALPTQETFAQPAGSKVVIRRQSASITLEVPAIGLRKGSMGLFFFACFWCAFMAFMTVSLMLGSHPARPRDLGIVPFLLVFWAAGLGMLAGAVYLGKRRATITAGRSGVTVIQTSPFGTKRRDIKRAEIATVCVGYSNMEVNHHHILELQFKPLKGKKVSYFAGRDPDELRWIATELRNALGLTGREASAPIQAVMRGYAAGRPQSGSKPAAAFVWLFVLLAGGFWWFQHNASMRFSSSRQRQVAATPKPRVSRNPAVGVPGLAFTSFAPGGGFGTNCWSVSNAAHADWFIAAASGCLSGLEVALEPTGAEPEAGKATIFLAQDRRGFPGKTLESFTVHARRLATGAAFKPITLESARQPALQAGVKYWLCARATGEWMWHFNSLNLIQNSARELQRGKWASAGDYTYVCAYSVKISTNQPATNMVEELESTTQPATSQTETNINE